MQACGICKGEIERNEGVVRSSWSQANNWGVAPKRAVVHTDCNDNEQEQIINGTLRLTELFTIKPKVKSSIKEE